MCFIIGLHGVDNGILTFSQVRIPRENLLDKLVYQHQFQFDSSYMCKGMRFKDAYQSYYKPDQAVCDFVFILRLLFKVHFYVPFHFK